MKHRKTLFGTLLAAAVVCLTVCLSACSAKKAIVTFDPADGAMANGASLTLETTLDANLKEAIKDIRAEKDDYAFVCWTHADGSEIAEDETVPEAGITVKANYSQTYRTIRFYEDDTEVGVQKVADGSKIPAPADYTPSIAGTVVGGWYTSEGSLYDLDEYVVDFSADASELKLYANIHTKNLRFEELKIDVGHNDAEGFVLDENGERALAASFARSGSAAWLDNEAIDTVVFPKYAGEKPLKYVAEQAVLNAKNITAIIIPDTVEAIGYKAFLRCESLAEIALPKELKTIGKEALAGVFALTSVTIPAGLKSIDSLFYNSDQDGSIVALKTVDFAPGSVCENINRAFTNCQNLETVNLPSSVKYFTDNCFRDCFRLTSIGEAVFQAEKIGTRAFKNCSALRQAKFDAISEIETAAFRNAFSKDAQVEFGFADNAQIGIGIFRNAGFSSVAIKGLTATPDYELTEQVKNEFILSVNAPDSNEAPFFYDCANLSSVSFDEALIRLGDATFAGTPVNPSAVSVPGASRAEMEFGEGLFFLSSAGSINVPNYFSPTAARPDQSVPAYAFAGGNFTDVVLNNRIKSLGDFSFAGCTIESEFVIPLSLVSISDSAFSECRADFSVESGHQKFAADSYYIMELDAQGNATRIIVDLDPNAANKVLPEGLVAIADSAYKENNNLVSVTIPSTVVTIGAAAFEGCGKLKEVIFAKKNGVCAVTTIGDRSFRYCLELQSIAVPKSIQKIGASAFALLMGQASALKTLTVEDGSALSSIGSSAFDFHRLETIDFGTYAGETLTIGAYAFRANKSEGSAAPFVIENYMRFTGTDEKDRPFSGSAFVSMKNVSFSSDYNREEIPDRLFYTYSGTELTLPASIKTIGDEAFSEMPNITSFGFTGPGALTSIGENAFAESFAEGSAISLDFGSAPLTSVGKKAFYRSNLTSVILPSGIKTLGESVFESCKALESLEMGYNVEMTLPKNFAKACSALKTLKLGQIEAIGPYAFSGCSELNAVTILSGSVTGASAGSAEAEYKSLSFIDTYAFQNCERLENFSFQNLTALTSVGDYAFKGTALKELNLPASLTTIGKNAFENVSTLRGSEITLNAAAAIGAKAFSGTYVIYTYTGTGAAADSFTNCAPAADTQNGFLIKDGVLTMYAGKEVDIVIPDTVTVIGQKAFAGYTPLQSVTIPASVTKIEGGTSSASPFYKSELTDVRFVDTPENPSQLTEIGAYAFYNLSGLSRKTIQLPASVKTIGNNAFANTFAVVKYTAGADVTVSASAMTNAVDANKSVPNADETMWFDADGMLLLYTGVAETVTVPASVFVSQADGEALSVSVTKIGNFAFLNQSSVKTVNLPAGISEIANGTSSAGAFKDSKIEAVDLTDCTALKTIGDYAFYATGLTGTMTLPASLETIGKYAFYATGLTGTMTLPASLKTIGTNAFEKTLGVTSIQWASSYQDLSIGSNAFRDSGLTGELLLPAGIKIIGSNAFGNTLAIAGNKITKIIIPSSVIGSAAAGGLGAIQYLDTLTEIVIGDSVNGTSIKSIPAVAFSNCTSLESIYIYRSSKQTNGIVTLSKDTAFTNVPATCKVYVPADLLDSYKVANIWKSASVVSRLTAMTEAAE